MMVVILGFCYFVISKFKSSIENKFFIKIIIKIYDFKRKFKLVLFNKKLLIEILY